MPRPLTTQQKIDLSILKQCYYGLSRGLDNAVRRLPPELKSEHVDCDTGEIIEVGKPFKELYELRYSLMDMLERY